MSNFKKSFELEAKVTGGSDAESQVKAIQEALDRLMSTGEITQEKLADLSKALLALESRGSAAAAAFGREVPESLKEVAKLAAEAHKELKKLSEEDIGKGGTGDASKLVHAIPPELLEAAKQLDNYLRTGVVPAMNQADAAAKKLEAQNVRLARAQAQVAQAQENRSLSQEVQGLNEVSAAMARLVQAREREAAAKRNVTAQEDPVKRTTAEREYAQAIETTTKAQERYNTAVTKAQAKSRAQEVKEANDLAKAEEKLAEAREKQAKGPTVGTKSAVEEARKRESAATYEQMKAQAQLNDVLRNSRSDSAQVATATLNLEDATDRAARATREHETASQQYLNTLPRTRYALYDVSRALTAYAAATVGVSTAAAAVSVNMSRDFANVIRTTETFMDSTGVATANLRREFNDLFTSMPTTWSNLTDLGALAGQMDIAAGSVAAFSETALKFSTATGVTVEASATALGRLSKLLDVSSDQYENLMSSILAVGTSSVATEAQIISISENIVGIASTAGWAADEVVGLSAAFASIGTAPELTRGIVTRFFTNIMTATTEGGERLQAFADAAGMTAAEFSKAWGEDAAGAFQQLMKSLGQLEGDEALQTLKELGITQVRDIPTVLKLAQNYDLLAQSMNIAAEGYEEGTLLGEHYGVVLGETATAAQLLKNEFTLLVANLGDLANHPAFTALLNFLQKLVSGASALASIPAVKWFVGLLGAVVALTGGLALFGASVAGIVGSTLGLRSALTGLATAFGTSRAQAVLAGLSFRNLAVEAGTAARGVSALQLALRGLTLGVGLGALITLGGLLAQKIQEAQREAKALGEAFKNIGPELQDAIKLDTQEWREATEAGDNLASTFRLIELSGSDAATGAEEMSESLKSILGITETTSAGLEGVADSADRATIALGTNFKVALAQFLSSDEDLISWLKASSDELDQFGFKLQEFSQALAQGTGNEYLDQIQARARAYYDEQVALIDRSTAAGAAAQAAEEGRFQNFLNVLQGARNAVAKFDGSLEDMNIQLGLYSDLLESYGVEVDEFGNVVDGASESVDGFRSVLSGFDTSAHDLQGAFYGLAEAVIKAEGDFSEFSVEGRNAMSALESTLNDVWAAGENAQDFAINLANMFAYAEGAGADLTSQVDILHQAMAAAFLDQWGLSLDTRQAHKSIADFIQATLSALEVRAQLEREMISRVQTSGLDNWAAATGDDYRGKQLKYHTDNLNLLNSQISTVKNLAANLNEAGNAGANAGRRIYDSLSPTKRNSGGSGAKKAKEEAKDLKEELRSLVDYANDLSSVYARAFEIRFSGSQTMDNITRAVRDMEQRFEEAAKRVRDLRLELQTLKASVSTLEAEISKQNYFLSIAVEYGDTARAEQIQARLTELNAELASKQAEVADTSKDLQKAQAETSRTTKGNSDAALQNRQDLESLVRTYADHIEALAKSGLSQDDLKTKTKELTTEFERNARQMGFADKDIATYKKSFEDLSTVIAKVPRNVTVKANTNPATQALNEWLAKNKNKSISVKANVSNPKLGTVSAGQLRPSSIYSTGPLSTSKVVSRAGSKVVITGGGGPGAGIMQMRSKGGPIYRAAGGVAGLHPGGPRGSDTIPAWLTPGEWVHQKKAVDYYGQGFMEAVNNRQIPRSIAHLAAGTQGGSMFATGPNGRVVVDLSVGTMHQLANIVAPKLVIGNKTIAAANDSANAASTTFGSN